MPDTPHHIEFIARGLVLRGQHLLVCANRKHGYLYLPGGHVEPGESSAAALVREFKEETGLTVEAGRMMLVSENAFTQRDRLRHEINLVFHVEHPPPGPTMCRARSRASSFAGSTSPPWWTPTSAPPPSRPGSSPGARRAAGSGIATPEPAQVNDRSDR